MVNQTSLKVGIFVIDWEFVQEELKKRYPCLNMEDTIGGCYDPLAGVIKADEALRVIWVNNIE